jgi:hypothetical protein
MSTLMGVPFSSQLTVVFKKIKYLSKHVVKSDISVKGPLRGSMCHFCSLFCSVSFCLFSMCHSVVFCYFITNCKTSRNLFFVSTVYINKIEWSVSTNIRSILDFKPVRKRLIVGIKKGIFIYRKFSV